MTYQKIFLLLFACYLLRAGQAAAQAQTGEEKVSLNGKWAFKTDPNNIGEEQQWFNPEYQALGWEKMAETTLSVVLADAEVEKYIPVSIKPIKPGGSTSLQICR